MFLLTLVLLLGGISIYPQAAANPETSSNLISQRQAGSCSTDPAWASTASAWSQANADASLKTFLTSVTTADDSVSFDRALGSRYGARYTSFKCGIDLFSTCPLPTCVDYQNDGEAWPYLATVSLVHLSTKFNILHKGISNGQLDFQGLIDDMATQFFRWKDPVFVGDDIAFWIVALITILFSALTLGLGAGPALAVTTLGVGAFLGAATQEVTLSLTPAGGIARDKGVAFLQKMSTELGQAGRRAVEAWANQTFAGLPDSQGNTIVDYFEGGGFLSDGAIPSPSDAEAFYKTGLLAKSIDWQWRTRSTFLMFAPTEDRNGSYGPQASRYYSEEKKGVYNLYSFDGGQLQEPQGLSVLEDKTYGIAPWQVTKSSARAWEIAGYNYSNEVARARIEDSFLSNRTLRPFEDGPAWEGVFTLPVCDVGEHIEWLTVYGGIGLPCCCGVKCADTKAFVQAANLNSRADYLHACKELLKNTLINFDNIDYGIDKQMSFRRKWEQIWSLEQKAGIVIGFIAVTVVVIIVTVMMCCCCCT